MRAAIGKPGEFVRMYMQAATSEEVFQQLQAGEVAVETTLERLARISADGTTVEEIEDGQDEPSED